MTNSALRRNVAEALRIASSADIASGRYRPDAADAARVVGWLASCDAAWLTCSTEQEAVDLEDNLKREWLPPLTKR